MNLSVFVCECVCRGVYVYVYLPTLFVLFPFVPVISGAMGCDQKCFKIAWRFHQLLSRFLVKGHLPRLSSQLRLSANDNGDNEMMPGAVHELLAFTVWLRKTSAKRPSDEGCANSHRLKWSPLPPNDVGSISERAREGEGRKRLGWRLGPIFTFTIFRRELCAEWRVCL